MNLITELLTAAVAVCLCGGAWGADRTSCPYVQHGLIACSDGLEKKIPLKLGLEVSRQLAEASAFTVDFACRPAFQCRRAALFSQYNGANDRGVIAVELNGSSHRACGGLRFYQQGDQTAWVNDFSENAYALADEEVTFAVVALPERRTFLKNGITCGAVAEKPPLRKVNAQIPCVVGGEPCRTNMTFCGEFHAYRLYARALPEAELMINAAVDAIRYRQETPAEVRLPAGASFDAQTNICVQACVEVAGEGMLTVGSNTQGTRYQAARPLNDTLALTAAPARAGLVFAGWEGDADLICRGSAQDASIQVAAARPFKLTARFRAADTKGKATK